jgi:predicted NAD/FAD-binding protein
MGAAIWSCPTAEMLGFPAQSFIRFFANHGLLQVSNRPVWRSIVGGSRAYVDALTAPFAGAIRRGVPVASLHRTPGGVVVRDAAGQEDRFDQVVVATHADQALAMLAEPTPLEREVLGAFRFQANEAVLHDDPALMPRRRRAWGAWNYLSEGRRGGAVSVTYWMNRLQPLPGLRPVFVSLNPFRAPRAGAELARFRYDHPVFDQRALAAQATIGAIQGRGGIWYCGAWCGYGFHEDGLAAGIAVAEALGARRPWTVQDMSPAARHCRPARPSAVAA